MDSPWHAVRPIASTFLASNSAMHGVTTVGPDRRYPRQDCENTGAIRPLINTNNDCTLPVIRQKVAGSLKRRHDRVNYNRDDIRCRVFWRSEVNYAGCGEKSRVAGPPRPARTHHRPTITNHGFSWGNYPILCVWRNAHGR